MPKDDGLVADVQSRASGALYNWNRPFNDQSVAYYSARRHEDIELNRLRRRYSRRHAAARSRRTNAEELAAPAGRRSGLIGQIAMRPGRETETRRRQRCGPSILWGATPLTICSVDPRLGPNPHE